MFDKWQAWPQDRHSRSLAVVEKPRDTFPQDPHARALTELRESEPSESEVVDSLREGEMLAGL